MQKNYSLPKLPYGFGALAPVISEEQLKLHYGKHHQSYVNGANAIFGSLADHREKNSDLDFKAVLKELSFYLGGHVLHSLFWQNLAPQNKGGGETPDGELKKRIDEEFGGPERFKKEFTQTALSVEGSGWAALVYSLPAGRLLISQVEKHNVNLLPQCSLLLVIDVWEHAYYLDYKNERAKFIEAFWRIVNWPEAGVRLKAALKQIA